MKTTRQNRVVFIRRKYEENIMRNCQIQAVSELLLT